MITIENACMLAKRFFKKESYCDSIAQILECDSCWIIVCGYPEDEPEMDPCSVVVEKETGAVSSFILPSPEGFALLRKAKETEIPDL